MTTEGEAIGVGRVAIVPPEAEAPDLPAETAQLGLGMLALVAVRLAPFAAVWSRYAFQRLWTPSSAPPLPLDVGSWAERAGIVVLAWPLAISWLIWLRRWPAMARAGAITFFALAIDRLVVLAVAMFLGREG